jgi:hypothetical protein
MTKIVITAASALTTGIIHPTIVSETGTAQIIVMMTVIFMRMNSAGMRAGIVLMTNDMTDGRTMNFTMTDRAGVKKILLREASTGLVTCGERYSESLVITDIFLKKDTGGITDAITIPVTRIAAAAGAQADINGRTDGEGSICVVEQQGP